MVQLEVKLCAEPPLLVEHRMVRACTIRDDHDPAFTAPVSPAQRTQEAPAELRIESHGLSLIVESAVRQSHRSKVAHLFTGWVVERDRVAHLWRNPHQAARTMLLEIHFVQCPEFHAGSAIGACSVAMRTL